MCNFLLPKNPEILYEIRLLFFLISKTKQRPEKGIIELGNSPSGTAILKNTDGLYVCDIDKAHKYARSGYAAIHQHWQAFIDQCKTEIATLASAESAILTTQFIEEVKATSLWAGANG